MSKSNCEQAKTVRDEVVPAGGARAWVIERGQRLRIVDLDGKQGVDFLCYNADAPEGRKIRAGTLRSVYRRGAGAFSSSHSPRVTSRAQWAMARVNSFLRGGPARKVDMPMFKKKKKKASKPKRRK